MSSSIIQAGIRASDSPLNIPPIHRHNSFQKVQYEDEYEKADASLQLAWSTLMDEEGLNKTSSFYKKVRCLLISWAKEYDDLQTDKEVTELASVLEDTFHFKVTRALLGNDSKHLAHIQVMGHVADFLRAEDDHHTLLLVYYAGHGSPRALRGGFKGLTLTGKRYFNEDPYDLNEVVWGDIETNFQHTKGDVLQVFDWQVSLKFVMPGTWDGHDIRGPQAGARSFEFLGACASGNLTSGPGEESFTTALIWALKTLVRDQTRFTVSELSCRVREAPNFPRDQVPVQLDRGVHAIERIILAPLPQKNGGPDTLTADPNVDGPQGILNLNFIFEKPPTLTIIQHFGKAMTRLMHKQQMPVTRIVWGGLASCGGVQPAPGGQSTVLKAAQKFREGLRRRTPIDKGATATRPSQLGLSTPSSGTVRLSPSSVADSLSQPSRKKRRKR